MISRLKVRQLAEEKEEHLSPNAVKSKYSRGRLREEEPCPVRTAFQRDRDRIIHSNAFRRLKHKTQVFIAPQGDHYMTRLTHTLEVSQIARTISRALNLNEDLTETIALGHDLGHTPFGHVGEEALNELYHRGFRHSEQSLRVVDRLENNGQGLNLTWEVRDGIVNHSKSQRGILEGWGELSTIEGEVCRMADMVAYVNHDIGDAIRAGIIAENDLPASMIDILGQSHSERVNTLVCDIIERSWAVRDSLNITRPAITMSFRILETTNILREFLFDRVYNLQATREEATRAREIVRSLYHYFMKHRDKLPPEYSLDSSEVERGVVDYIAGMTDEFASRLAEELSLTRSKG